MGNLKVQPIELSSCCFSSCVVCFYLCYIFIIIFHFE